MRRLIYFLVLSLLLFLITSCKTEITEPAVEPTLVSPSITLKPSSVPTALPPATNTPEPLSIIQSNNVNDLGAIHIFEGHGNAVRSLAFSPDRTLLAASMGGNSARSGYDLRLWDVSAGNLAGSLEGHTNIVWDVTFSPDGGLIASGSKDGTVRLWRVSDGEQSQSLLLPGEVGSLAFSPDGQMLATGVAEGTEGWVYLWRTADMSPERSFAAHNWNVPSLAFSPDGSKLVTGAVDRTTKLWRVSDGMLLRTMSQDGQGMSVAFSPDGTLIASGMCALSTEDLTCVKGEVWIWWAADGTRLVVMGGVEDWIRDIAFSPDGSLIAGGSDDGTVRIWRVSDGELLRTLEGHRSAVEAVAFSPDGRFLASGSTDETVWLWGVHP